MILFFGRSKKYHVAMMSQYFGFKSNFSPYRPELWKCFTLRILWVLAFRYASSETQGQIVGARESLNGRENKARRKVKNGEKSPWGQGLTRPVPNGCRLSGF